MKSIITIWFFIFFVFPIAADEFHNIHGLHGERAVGLAGAYAAISDDPSGAYYNPAGLAFATHNYVSISASAYDKSSKIFDNLVGLSQSYERDASGYTPNLIGSLNLYDKLAFAFTVINEFSENYHQGDQFRYPHIYSDFQYINSGYTENSSRFLFGPSLAYRFSEKLSLGITTFYFIDRSQKTTSSVAYLNGNDFISLDADDTRSTDGLEPVLGIQYNLTDILTLGLSIKKKFITLRHRKYYENSVPSGAKSTNNFVTIEATGDTYSQFSPAPNITGFTNNLTVGESNLTDEIGDMAEGRFGFAFYPNQRTLISVDVIRTDGKSVNKNFWQIDAYNPYILFFDDSVGELEYLPTTNYAIGFEYFITESIVLRTGYFTNKSNVKKVDTDLRRYNFVTGEITIEPTQIGDKYYSYYTSKFYDPARNEDVDLEGYSLAFGFETQTNSISLSFVLQKGRGKGQPELLQRGLPSALIYDKVTAIFSAGLKY